MVEGRARDERHDGRRGHAAARVPRRFASRRRPSGRPPWIRSKQRERRLLDQLLRRARRPLDDRRGLCRAAARRRRSRARAHAARRARSSASRAESSGLGCSPTSGWRCSALWSWDAGADAAAGADPAAGRGARSTSTTSPAGLGRRSWRCRSSSPTARCGRCRSRSTSCAAPSPWSPPTAGSPVGERPGQRSTASLHALPAAPGPVPARARAGARRALDRRSPGGRRLVGRHPAAVGLLDARTAPARLPARSSGDAGAGSTGLDGSRSDDGAERRLEACQSPVWDTALAMIALADAGVPADDEALSRGADWLLGEQVHGRGDWAVRRPDLRARRMGVRVRQRQLPRRRRHRRGGAGAASASPPATAADARRAIERGLALAGGDAELRRRLGRVRRRQLPGAAARELPFCDFGEVIDPPSADVTAHARRDARGRRPRPATARPARRRVAARRAGSRRLVVRPLGRQPRLRHRRGRAGADRRRRRPGRRADPPRRRAGSSSTRTTTAAGARTPRSYDDPELGRTRRRAPPRRPPGRCWRCTPPASARTRSSAGCGGWSSTQLPDGTWDEPQYTGTGFPSDFYINYHLYRLVFPIMALGRLHAMTRCSTAARHDRALPAPTTVIGTGRATRTSRCASLIVGTTPAGAPAARSTGSRGWSTTSATRQPATAARCSTGSTRSSTGSTRSEQRPASADGAACRRASASCSLPDDPVPAAGRRPTARTRWSRAMRHSTSCSTTASCRPRRWASWSCTSSSAPRPTGSRCPTGSAPGCRSPSTSRTSPRTSSAGGSTCPAEDLLACGCDPEDPLALAAGGPAGADRARVQSRAERCSPPGSR